MVFSSVAIINAGRIVMADKLENLTGRSRDAVRIEMRLKRAPSEALSRLQNIPGVQRVRHIPPGGQMDGTFVVETQPNVDLREELATMAVKENWGLLEIRRAETSIEDIFLRVTTEGEERVEVEK